MKNLFIMILSMATVLGANAQNKKILVTYFSCTGTTETVAKSVAKSLGADLYEIAPKEAYTSADLNWNNKSSRSSIEMRDPKSRPQLLDAKANIQDYDVVLVGFPVWWYKAPTIINTFLEAYDFSGKTVIPFATSGGSGIDSSEQNLHKAYPELKWGKGRLLNGAVTDKVLKEWLGGVAGSTK